MKKPDISIWSLILFFLLSVGISFAQDASQTKDSAVPFKNGETFKFKVKIKGISAGESVLTFKGEEVVDGQRLYHITFSTRIPGLRDTEEIYAYPDTFLPAKVMRTVNQIGSFMARITEVYDQSNFSVAITKKGKLFTDKMTIQKKGPIHNAILLSYYFRMKHREEDTSPFKVILPTAEFDVVFKGKEDVDTFAGSFQGYVFKSVPPKFVICVSADNERLPLKIQSPGAMGYAMTLSGRE